MKTFARLMSLVLALLFVACLAVSCATPGDDSSGTTTPTASATTPADGDTSLDSQTENQYDVKNNLPSDLQFPGQTVRILSRDSDGVRDEIAVNDYIGEPVNDAIYERNAAVEAQLGIKISNTKLTGGNYVVTEKIRNLVMAQTDEYDLLANSCYSTIMYTSEGLFQDLSHIEYLDLDRIYWSQGFNEVASFGNRQYFCAGSIGLTLYRYMFVNMFSKTMLKEFGVDDLYTVVNDGKWTLDYQAALASQMYYDVNGSGTQDADDKYGFVSGPMAYVDPYWSSCKLPILTKTTDNRYEYAVNVERTALAMDKVLNLYYTCGGSYIYKSVSDAQDQENIASHFANGRAAMCTLRLLSVESQTLRNMKDEYGIVPIPKLDEAQDGYQTFVHDQFTALAVPATVPESRLDLVGAYMECTACESHRRVIPAYYEVALKGKYVSDPQSGQMLDKIYENIYIDAGVLYTKVLNSVHQQLRTIVKSQTNGTVTVFKSLNRAIPVLLDKMMAGLDKLDK